MAEPALTLRDHPQIIEDVYKRQDMTIGRLTPGDLANIQEPETLYELLSDEDMENIFQFKEDTQNETD